ncbi:la-related protein 6a [Cololabis saira]|uniref:la-related protein 6a n=1 Tax=Cololabis saira TaxID=129043 RepID=UPI002AD52226|nr:la-related protein 6a [Cololabis saira]
MHALVNAFLRCVSFLLPPSWPCVSRCAWAGRSERPNPRARLRGGEKPLTYEEVSAEEAADAADAQRRSSSSSASVSPRPGCVSPAAAAANPAEPPAGLWIGGAWIGGAWRCVERVLAAPWLFLRGRCGPKARRAAAARTALDAGRSARSGEEGGGDWPEPPEGPSRSRSTSMMSGSAGSPGEEPEPEEPGTEQVMAVEQQLEVMGTVTITVAIQAAEEDDDPEEDRCSSGLMDLLGASCSEDEVGRHDKSSGAGTSGGEVEEESWQPPDTELSQKLVSQIEYYMSDENLEHDAFLLKHVRRNKLGFVSVKLLTSFKKVKHLTRDWRTTSHALKNSKILELNDEGRKVRRKSMVPVFASESLPSRMLLLSDLQRWPELAALTQDNGPGDGGATQQEQLMKLLLKAFGTYGTIASVRVLKPGKDLPADLKRLSGRYPQLGVEECAIVEFEEVEAAVKANEAVGSEDGGTSSLGLKVVLIGTKPPKKKVPKERPREEGGMRKSRSLNSRVRELQYHGDDSACSSSDTESNPTSPRLARKSQSCNKLSPTTAGIGFQNNHLSPGMSPRNSPWSSPRASPCTQRKSPHPHKSPLASEGRLSPEPGRRWADYSSDSSLTPSGSPWVQRRKQVASQESSPVGSPMLGRKIQNADGLPPGVTRLPRGPDGTRGFHGVAVAERGKSAATQT